MTCLVFENVYFEKDNFRILVVTCYKYCFKWWFKTIAYHCFEVRIFHIEYSRPLWGRRFTNLRLHEQNVFKWNFYHLKYFFTASSTKFMKRILNTQQFTTIDTSYLYPKELHSWLIAYENFLPHTRWKKNAADFFKSYIKSRVLVHFAPKLLQVEVVNCRAMAIL